jgi:hypothetical protein
LKDGKHGERMRKILFFHFNHVFFILVGYKSSVYFISLNKYNNNNNNNNNNKMKNTTSELKEKNIPV